MNDCISRQAVIDLIKKHNVSYGDIFITDQKKFIKCLNELPSDTPTERTGHWINITEQNLHYYRTGNKLCFECDQCHHQFTYSSNFCPDCGSKND